MKPKKLKLLLAGVPVSIILCVIAVMVYRGNQDRPMEPPPPVMPEGRQAAVAPAGMVLALGGLSQAQGADLDQFLMEQPELLGDSKLNLLNGPRDELRDILAAAREQFRGSGTVQTLLGDSARVLGRVPNVFGQLRRMNSLDSELKLQDHLSHLLDSVADRTAGQSPARFCQAIYHKNIHASASLSMVAGPSTLPLPGWLRDDIRISVLMGAGITPHPRPMGENR